LNHPKPPQGYKKGSVLGWITAVNYGHGEGYVLIRALRIYGIDTNGKRHIEIDKFICETCSDPDDQVWGYDMPRKLWHVKKAWDRPNHGSVFEVLENGVVKIPTSDKPKKVFHMWNLFDLIQNQWERHKVKPGWSYGVEAEVFPVGSGMIQIGFDYWKANEKENKEAANSDWVCSSTNGDWVTVSIGTQ